MRKNKTMIQRAKDQGKKFSMNFVSISFENEKKQEIFKAV